MLLTTNDIALIPGKGVVESRTDVLVKSTVGKNKWLELPIFAANMDTVTNEEMCLELHDWGAAGVLHRNMSINDQAKIVKNLHAAGVYTYAAVGTCWDEYSRISTLVDYSKIDCLCVDVAHGHSVNMKRTLEYIKKNYPNVEIIAGNVATKQGVKDLFKWGADIVKVGIGPGAACITRIQTGYGVPQFSAVLEAVKGAKGKPIIADGGISSPGDAAKLLGAGAHAVMVGSLFAGCDEAPGDIIEVAGKQMKAYRGMASAEAGSDYPEGVSGYVEYKGSVIKVLDEFDKGLRSAISYAGFDNINDFRGNARWEQQTNNGFFEGKPKI